MKRQTVSGRIAKNTAILYFRLLLTMVVSLYTSRVILNSLGVSDFGIYNVVGGVIAMFSFFVSSISSSFQRFFCVELAENNVTELRKIVNSSVLILIVLSIFILIFAETIGLWFIKNKLVIPPNRLNQAVVVFQFSVFSLIVSLFQSIYNAIIISYEKMNVYAYITIFDVLAKLFVALSISFFSGDRLVYYSILIFLVSLTSLLLYYIYCRKSYEVVRGKSDLNIKLLLEMFSFSGWTLFGTFANVLKSNGLNILLNIFFGPIVNAARGISYQVYTAVNSFTRSFQVAFTPQITKSYAQGDLVYLHKLMLSSSKISYYLMLFLSIPLFIDIDLILNLWLGNNVPEHTALFTKIVILTGLVESLSAPIVNIIYASGKIQFFQLSIAGIIILVIPFSYYLLKVGYPPESALITSLTLTLIAHLIRLFFLKKSIPFKKRKYIEEVALPVVAFTTLMIFLPQIISQVYISNIYNYILVTIVIELIFIFIVYLFGLRKEERSIIKNRLFRIYAKS